MDRRAIKKIIIGVSAIFAVMILAQLIFYANIYFEKKTNHGKVVQLVSKDLLYSWDTLDEELDYLNELINKKHYFNEDLGRLYERASLIYMQKGETMTYYRYLGYALYYLERSSEKDYTVNIYLDLANFFLNNYTGDAAKNMIQAAQAVEDFEDIQDIQIKSYAFRMLGIMAIFDEDYDAAEKYLEKAQEIVAQSHTNVYEESYMAIDDTWLARVYVETGRLDECKEKLDKWDGHSMFTTDVYRRIMLRDLIVPYYQVKCFYSAAMILDESKATGEKLSEDQEKQIAAFLEEFMVLCEENGYEKAELSTILKLQSDYPPASEEIRITLYGILNRLYTELFDNQNITYANVIDSTVTDSKSEMAKNEQLKKNIIKRTEVILFSVLVIIAVMSVFTIILLNSRYDGLTGLFSRKIFDHDIEWAKKKNSEYGVIMIDIDDFKRINDTYGHQNGDIVLGRLGQIMQREISIEVHCYRYGGEEFVILLDSKALPYAERLAERIRSNMEQQAWEFGDNLIITISLGLATGSGTADVLKQADDNLYKAKKAGKNQVVIS